MDLCKKRSPLKRLLSFAAAAASALALMPWSSLPALAVTEYDLFVCGKQVTSANASNLANGAASYDAASNTLTVTQKIDFSSFISAKLIECNTANEFTLKLCNGAQLEMNNTWEWSSVLDTKADVVITGTGSLSSTYGCPLISSGKKITIKNADLTLTGKYFALSSVGSSAGDSVQLTIEHSDLNASVKEAHPGNDGLKTLTYNVSDIILKKSKISYPLAAKIWNLPAYSYFVDQKGKDVGSISISKYTPDTTYDLWVNGIQADNYNCMDILQDGGSAVFNPSDAILTLKDTINNKFNHGVQNQINNLNIILDGTVKYLGTKTAIVNEQCNAIISGGCLKPHSVINQNVYAATQSYKGTLTLKDTDITGDLSGNGHSDTKLYINKSKVNAPGGIKGFGGGITLNSSDITSPTNPVVNQTVYFSNGITPATGVVIEPITVYNLTVGGKNVDEKNCNDILGNGKFKYVPDENILYVYGDLPSGTTQAIANSIPDLTVRLMNDVGITGTGTGISAWNNTTIDGPGSLTVPAGRNAVSAMFSAQVTIAGTTVNGDINGYNYNTKLYLDNCTVNAPNGIKNFGYGINFWYSAIAAPADAMLSADKKSIVDKDGEIAQNVSIKPSTPYGLYVSGTEVNSVNYADILGDGVFSYNPDSKTLTISGDYTAPADSVSNVIDSMLHGLTINIAEDCTINSPNHTVFYLKDYALLTGPGKLTLNTGNASFYLDDAGLSINYMDIEAQCKYFVTASNNYNDRSYLYINNSNIHVNASTAAVTSISSGISILGCQITTPGTVVNNTKIVDADGYTAKKLTISTVTNLGDEDVTLSKTVFEYTGKAVKCGSSVSVKIGDTKLKYGTDFTLEYNNNVNIGYHTATVTIVGMGNYAGTVTKEYSIVPVKQAVPALSWADGKLHVRWSADSKAYGYQVQYCQNQNFTGDTLHSATYAKSATSCDLSKYQKLGETWYVRVKAFVSSDGTTSGSKAGLWSNKASLKLTEAINSVTLSKTVFPYTSKAVKCGSAISVKSGSTKLKYGTDFTLEYDNNVNIGYHTATVTVVGMGNYTGSVTKEYSIVPVQQAAPALSWADNKLHIQWTADSKADGYQVQYCQNQSFTGDTLHSAAYAKSKTSCDLSKYQKPGETWYVRVKAFVSSDGTTSGSKAGLWSDAQSIQLIGTVDSVTLSQDVFAYTGKAVKVGSYITVKSGSTKLKYGTDYTMDYEANTAQGINTAKVTVTGIGNYTGTVSKTYTIAPAKQTAPALTAVSGGFKVTWAADTTAAGYQVIYSKDPTFNTSNPYYHAQTYAAGKTSVTLTKYSQTGETWYVKVRAFMTADGTASGTKYGVYSETASIVAG